MKTEEQYNKLLKTINKLEKNVGRRLDAIRELQDENEKLKECIQGLLDFNQVRDQSWSDRCIKELKEVK